MLTTRKATPALSIKEERRANRAHTFPPRFFLCSFYVRGYLILFVSLFRKPFFFQRQKARHFSLRCPPVEGKADLWTFKEEFPPLAFPYLRQRQFHRPEVRAKCILLWNSPSQRIRLVVGSKWKEFHGNFFDRRISLRWQIGIGKTYRFAYLTYELVLRKWKQSSLPSRRRKPALLSFFL